MKTAPFTFGVSKTIGFGYGKTQDEQLVYDNYNLLQLFPDQLLHTIHTFSFCSIRFLAFTYPNPMKDTQRKKKSKY